MRKELHKIESKDCGELLLTRGHWDTYLHMSGKPETPLEPADSTGEYPSIPIKIDPEVIRRYLVETGATLRIMKARTWYHVQAIEPGRKGQYTPPPPKPRSQRKHRRTRPLIIKQAFTAPSPTQIIKSGPNPNWRTI